MRHWSRYGVSGALEMTLMNYELRSKCCKIGLVFTKRWNLRIFISHSNFYSWLTRWPIDGPGPTWIPGQHRSITRRGMIIAYADCTQSVASIPPSCMVQLPPNQRHGGMNPPQKKYMTQLYPKSVASTCTVSPQTWISPYETNEDNGLRSSYFYTSRSITNRRRSVKFFTPACLSYVCSYYLFVFVSLDPQCFRWC